MQMFECSIVSRFVNSACFMFDMANIFIIQHFITLFGLPSLEYMYGYVLSSQEMPDIFVKL